MKCFGSPSRSFPSKVVLLDEQELIQEIHDTTTGQQLLEIVFSHLNLVETAYFGLRYLDTTNQTHWLDPTKKVWKQLRGTSPFTLYFSVKFYAADPCRLVEEITRYQFFLQVKQDILQGRLPVSQDLAAELGAYAVQSELGDHDPRRHSPGYVSEFRFVTTQTVTLENRISDLHKKLIGQVPSKAELCYLEKVKWLDMYGVDLHPVLGEDNIEYFLGLTPSGVIVLRNKAKVGNYFWPRISKVYFRGRFFMLRVRDKNNSENTYGFETPSKAACKHLWQCCVEHHAFFRLTQASGNSAAAIFSLGAKLGRSEKDGEVGDARLGSRAQPEFTRMPSRRYQRRIVEGAQDAPCLEDSEVSSPQLQNNGYHTHHNLSSNMTTSSSHMYRSHSVSLSGGGGGCHNSPHSTRSAPHTTANSNNTNGHSTSSTHATGRARGESPRSVHSAATTTTTQDYSRMSRRASSVDSQSSVESRGHRRHRRSRGRSSDGESEASSKCSSRGHHHRHHRHNRHHHHNSDDSEHHRHRHRRRRHKSGGSEPQWAQVTAGQTQVKGHTATVRDLTHKSGYQPSGVDTEADSLHPHRHHSNSKRRHRKHRSRSRSPSEARHSKLPEELRRHLALDHQPSPTGMTEAELREIPYTKVETARTIKIKYAGSPKTRRHRSPRRSKSNSSDRKASLLADGESPPPPYTPNNPSVGPTTKTTTLPKASRVSMNGVRTPDGALGEGREGVNTTSRTTTTTNTDTPNIRNTPTPIATTTTTTTTTTPASLPRVSPGPPSHTNKTEFSSSSSSNSSSSSASSSSSSRGSSSTSDRRATGYHDSAHIITTTTTATTTSNSSNAPVTPANTTTTTTSSGYRLNSSSTQPPAHTSSSGDGTAASSLSSGSQNNNNYNNTALPSVLRPQSSPQSSVTSGISVGSSCVSIGPVTTTTTTTTTTTPFHTHHNHNHHYHHDYHSSSSSGFSSGFSSSLDHSYENVTFDLAHNQTTQTTQTHRHYPPTTATATDHSKEATNPHPQTSQLDHNDRALPHQDATTTMTSRTPITQHSTNILIQYHHHNPPSATSIPPEASSSSISSSSSSAPTPLPRSSIISSMVGQETSTHIVQSYGPVPETELLESSARRHFGSNTRSDGSASLPHIPYSNYIHPSTSSSSSTTTTTTNTSTSFSSSIFNATQSPAPSCYSTASLTRRKVLTHSSASQTTISHRNKPLSLSSSTIISPMSQSSSASHLTTPCYSTSSLTRRRQPVTRTTASQTQSLQSKASQTNSDRRNPPKTPNIEKERQKHHSQSQPRGSPAPSLTHSAAHWKVYNWGRYGEEAEWAGSGQEQGATSPSADSPQRIADGRRGSAGSLEVVLGPLIQSAIMHQQH